jgi:hypothetical protein
MHARQVQAFNHMITQEIKIDLFADYRQFYIQDEKVDRSLSDDWTEESVQRLLAFGPGTIAVGTVRSTTVAVTIKLFDKEPDMLRELSTIGQINECDLETSSDTLIVAGCTDFLPDAMRIKVNTGIYRARIYYGNLDELIEDEFDGEDFYEIHLWPTKEKNGLKILKSRKASA